MSERVVRLGGASGYWGDTALGPQQLITGGEVDYVILDYLAEITMSILAKAHSKHADEGYALDFITRVIQPFLPQIAEKRVRILANAGGVNLDACRAALEMAMADAGVSLKIGTVEGDNLLPSIDRLRGSDIREMDSGAALPSGVMSVNAYLGAFPIAAALDHGADIVVTGRCVDSALALAPLIHEFGWTPSDYDRLAAGSLIGHIIECGAQTTGGNFTDWQESEAGWEDTGFPVVEAREDGTFILTKPRGTGGHVSPLTVAEQMLYEIGDPANYLLPDVNCDFSDVRMTQEGKDRVLISGARGGEPTDSYKVSATYADGYACVGTFVVAGEEASKRARRQGEAVLKRAERMLAQGGMAPFEQTSIQVIGTESIYGAAANPDLQQNREVVLRVAVQHKKRDAADLFSKEFIGAGLSMSPGLALLTPGRPKPTPVVRLFSFLIDKKEVPIIVKVDGKVVDVPEPVVRGKPAKARKKGGSGSAVEGVQGDGRKVLLRALAVARSGDKGNKANIGVIARRPEYFPFISQALTADAVAARFGHFVEGEVHRFELPGVAGLNFLLHEALGGGGAASLRLDTQGKTYAQNLLDVEIIVPGDLLAGESPK